VANLAKWHQEAIRRMYEDEKPRYCQIHGGDSRLPVTWWFGLDAEVRFWSDFATGNGHGRLYLPNGTVYYMKGSCLSSKVKGSSTWKVVHDKYPVDRMLGTYTLPPAEGSYTDKYGITDEDKERTMDISDKINMHWQEIEKLQSMPEEPLFEDGTGLILITVQFSEKGTVYTYAGVRAAETHRWYLTGITQTSRSYDWASLMEWLTDKVKVTLWVPDKINKVWET
jgi:hypothetical protein